MTAVIPGVPTALRSTPAPHNRPTISFVVTALNEEPIIASTVEELRMAVKNHFADYEILLVNDGSTDSTGEKMEELARGDRRITVIHNEINLGPGGAYKRGVARARHQFVMWVCGDNAVPAKELEKIFERIGEADIVIPYILNPDHKSRPRRMLSSTFVGMLNLLFGQRLHYYNHLVVYPTDVLREITIRTNGFAFQAESIIKTLKRGHSYVEVGTINVWRTAGRSTALRLRNWLSVGRTIGWLIRDVYLSRGNMNSGSASAVAAGDLTPAHHA